MAMRSMTGFAAIEGECDSGRWRWELRSVNGRGHEIRFRTPSGFENAERRWREALQERFQRGTLTAMLALEQTKASRTVRLDPAALEAAFAVLKDVAARAAQAGLTTTPPALDAILAMKGVIDSDSAEETEDADARRAELEAAASDGLERAIDELATSRAGEGARLARIMTKQIDEIERLVGAAQSEAEARSTRSADLLRDRVHALIAAEAPIDEARLAQELALLAVKSDVSEELDRLGAHIAAARDLIAAPPPSGRKMEFLTQEFNREANTLCAKAQSQALTEIGLSLKVVIDQLREQSANIE